MTNSRYHFNGFRGKAGEATKAYRNMFCVNHSGKMAGNISISTSPLLNERCKMRANCSNVNCICKACYALSMQDMYSDLAAKLIKNTAALTGSIISWDAIPDINAGRHEAARIEAFADLNNTTQAINYINLIAKNTGVIFGWWTKNPDIIADALEAGYKKPENVVIIYSDPVVNGSGPDAINAVLKKYRFIDKVFTVYSNEDAAKAAGVVINCGARHCMSCKLCYTHNNVVYINEILK